MISTNIVHLLFLDHIKKTPDFHPSCQTNSQQPTQISLHLNIQHEKREVKQDEPLKFGGTL